MVRNLTHPISLICLLALILIGGWFAFLPARYAGLVAQGIEKKMGRTLTIDGGAGFVFSPHFGIGLHDVTLAGASALAEPVIRAKTLTVPLSILQLITGLGDAKIFLLDQANINVTINGQGHSNVLIEQEPSSAKTDSDAAALKPITLKISDSHFRFRDERNGNAFELKGITGETQFMGDGSITATGAAVINDQFINFDANLASLQRSFAEGSPFDLSADGVASSFAFSGRLATGGSINLAGQAEVTSTDGPRLLRWLGADLNGFAAAKKLSLSGALESNGSTFSLKEAKLKWAQMNARGEVSISFEGERPALRAALGFDQLDFNLYQQTTSGGSQAAQSWTEKPYDLSNLKALDIELKLSTTKLRYNDLETGVATLEAKLKDRKLDATIKSSAVAGGAGDFAVDFDAAQLPAKLKLNLDLMRVEANPVLAALFGMKWLSGPLTLSTQLSAVGNSQAELLSTLGGQAQIGLQDGVISGVDIGKIAGAASKNIVEGWAGEKTQAVNAAITLAFKEGIATVGSNEITTPDLSLSASGEIDLLRRSLDLSSDPTLKRDGGADLKLPVGIKVTGAWDHPKIYADLAGVLENPKAAYETLKAIGLPEVSTKRVKKLLDKLIGN
jgi:AsmA protein